MMTKIEKKLKHMQTKSYLIELVRKQGKKELEIWKQFIRKSARNKCEVCGADKILNVHHILPKERYPQFKTNPMNGVLLCPSHHKFGKISAHRNGIWFSIWLQRTHPANFIWAVANLGEQ